MAVKASATICIFNVDDGDDGKGISSTAVTYQAGSSQTTTPTGTWSSSVPTLTTALPYLWTRTVITYSDGTTSTSYSVSSTLESFEVGGRNLLLKTADFSGWSKSSNIALSTDSEGYTVVNFVEVSTLAWNCITCLSGNSRLFSEVVGKTLTLSLEAKSTGSYTSSRGLACVFSLRTGSSSSRTFYGFICASMSAGGTSYPSDISSEWQKFKATFTVTETGIIRDGASSVTAWSGSGDDIDDDTRYGIQIYNYALTDLYVRKVKLETGNIATDWSPAPEDTAQDIADVQEDLSDEIARVENDAQLKIDSLNAVISTLVVDENGESLMTQTSDGWQFDMSSVINNVATVSTGLDDANSELSGLSSSLASLVQTVAGLSTLTAYIRIGQDSSGNPYIELGADGSDFKARITNSDIKFFDGSSVPAYISNQSLNIDTAIVDDEILFGGHSLKIRSNGHLGISWKG